MNYAVMIEPFEFEGYEYVRNTNSVGGWDMYSEIKSFNTKEEAKKEAKKWNTGIVVNMEENLK